MASGEEEVSRIREKNERQQQPELCTTSTVLHAQDVQQLIGHQEERPLQGGSAALKLEDPQEEEELWITHEGLQRREEADRSKLPLTGVSVKTEEREDKAHVQQLVGHQKKHPRQPQGGISTLKQEDPQPAHVKEEEEELWASQEEECLVGNEEADLSKFPLTGVSVKTEEHEDKPPLSSQLHYSSNDENGGAEPPSGRSPQRMTTEAEGDHCGASQADKLLAPLSDSDDATSCSPEDEDGDDTREALSSDPDCEGDMRTHADKRSRRSGKKSDVHQLIGHQEERPCQPQGGISTLKQEDPQPST
ncbi:uncharacterized protein LOC129179219 isoform X3 [Dunckerocampus dactyliophorus]|uniref:uncharacterized protein LOC129179219 isoform X3 n=1 Tax=Dunckerocampus dactyliophorus TaxID=161453 RepID=UPI0024073FDA|nr:uncharacterized protein LOC129179219 isoform X3 [Dunckerocampus dactyliophorus]